ncbi:hypothetical protein HanIR_Chr14g0676771 [Helianthus annuus]|nr:hypothetical protein HanIR_Chr14g0676771 [Helianthus annuus]
MDNGRPPTDIPVKPTYKYVLIRGFRSSGAVTEFGGAAELKSRVDAVFESRLTRQYENDVALIWEGKDNVPPPSARSPAAPTNNPSLSLPHPNATFGTEPDLPNVTVSVTSLPTVNDPSPYET